MKAAALLLPEINKSIGKQLVSVCSDHGCELKLHDYVSWEDYQRIFVQHQNIMTWGIKLPTSWFKNFNKNILYFENGLVSQREGVYIDHKGWFSDSSIVSKNSRTVPTAEESDRLRRICKDFFGWGLFQGGDPDGPIMYAMQVENDQAMHYFDGCKDMESPRWKGLDLLQKAGLSKNILIRRHPEDDQPFPEINWSEDQNYEIDESDNVYETLRGCSGLVTINSTLVFEALSLGLPVGTFGRGAFTSSGLTFECAMDASRMKDFSLCPPDEDQCLKFLCNVLSHQISYGADIQKVKQNKSLQIWLESMESSDEVTYLMNEVPSEKPLLSVSIIMKNEEKCIQRCIDGCSFADEIIINDTGSTDKSIEIAERNSKVKVFRSDKFNKDTSYDDFSFSKARNECIDKCNGEFIVWVDCDDVIDESNAQRIRQIAETEKRDCLFTFSVHYGATRFDQCRMFRNKGVKFDEDHSCHEYLLTGGRQHISRKDIVVAHLPDIKQIPSLDRNLAILEKDFFSRNQCDARTVFYLANTYRESNRFGDAVEFYDKYLDLSEWAEERFFARYYKAQCLVKMDNIGKAIEETFSAIIEDMRFAEPYCLLGDICFKTMSYDAARHWYGLAMTIPFPADAKLFVIPALYDAYPMQKITDINSIQEDQRNKLINLKKETVIREPSEISKAIVLPKDKELAVAIAGSLSGISVNGSICSLIADNDWQSDMIDSIEGVSLVEDHPEKIKIDGSFSLNTHIFDQALRMIGIVKPYRPIRFSKKTNVGKNNIVLFGNLQGVKGVVSDWLRGESHEVQELETELFSEVVSGFSQAKIVVCDSGWAAHIAAGLGVPSLVVWDDEQRMNIDKWDGQRNILEDISGLPKTVVDNIKQLSV